MNPVPWLIGAARGQQARRLYRVGARMGLFVVIPLFILQRFVTNGMTFPASMVGLLTVLVIGFGVISLDVLEIKHAHVDTPRSDDPDDTDPNE